MRLFFGKRNPGITVALFCLVITVISCRRTPSTPFTATLKADVGGLVAELADDAADTLLQHTIAAADKGMADGAKPYIVLFVEAYRKQQAGKPLVSLFSKKSGLPATVPDEAVAVWLDQQIAGSVTQAARVLSARLTEMRSADVVVRMNKGRGFLQVTCKTDRSSDDLRALLIIPGKLEMFRAYENYDVFPVLRSLNDAMAPKDVSSVSVTGGDTAHLLVNGKSNSSLMAQNPLFALVAPNVDAGSGSLNDGPICGMVKATDQHTADSVFGSPNARKILPLPMKFLPGKAAAEDKVLYYYAAKLQPGAEAEISNVHIKESKAEKNAGMEEDEYTVNLIMTEPGKLRWKKMTGDCIGKYILVVLDGKVFASPRVLNEIPNGQTTIGGKFTKQGARDLAAALKCGALPVALRVVDNATETITEL